MARALLRRESSLSKEYESRKQVREPAFLNANIAKHLENEDVAFGKSLLDSLQETYGTQDVKSVTSDLAVRIAIYEIRKRLCSVSGVSTSDAEEQIKKKGFNIQSDECARVLWMAFSIYPDDLRGVLMLELMHFTATNIRGGKGKQKFDMNQANAFFIAWASPIPLQRLHGLKRMMQNSETFRTKVKAVDWITFASAQTIMRMTANALYDPVVDVGDAVNRRVSFSEDEQVVMRSGQNEIKMPGLEIIDGAKRTEAGLSEVKQHVKLGKITISTAKRHIDGGDMCAKELFNAFNGYLDHFDLIKWQNNPMQRCNTNGFKHYGKQTFPVPPEPFWPRDYTVRSDRGISVRQVNSKKWNILHPALQFQYWDAVQTMYLKVNPYQEQTEKRPKEPEGLTGVFKEAYRSLAVEKRHFLLEGDRNVIQNIAFWQSKTHSTLIEGDSKVFTSTSTLKTNSRASTSRSRNETEELEVEEALPSSGGAEKRQDQVRFRDFLLFPSSPLQETDGTLSDAPNKRVRH